MTTRIAVLACLLLLCATAARSQDSSQDSQETLTEAAAREKARRAAQKAKTVKKFTDEDLKKLAGKPKPGAQPKTGEPASAAQSAPDSSADAGEGEPPDPSRAEFWRPRVEPAQAELAQKQAAVSQLEEQLRELRMSQTRPVRLGEPNRDFAIAQDIRNTTEALDAARKAVDEAKQVLEEILEEARRAGVPASQFE